MTIRYKLSQELSDGQHWSVVDTSQQVLEIMKEWFFNFEIYPKANKGFSVETVDMTDDEVDALPSI